MSTCGPDAIAPSPDGAPDLAVDVAADVAPDLSTDLTPDVAPDAGADLSSDVATVIADAGPTDTGSAQLLISPSSQSFMGQVGRIGPRANFTVANAGGTPIDRVSVTVDGEFIVASNGCLTPLASGESCNVQAAFKPLSVGMKTGTLTVSTSAGSVVHSQLTGTAELPPTLTITPTLVSFANVQVGFSSPATDFLVKNSGSTATSPLTVSTGNASFVITANTCTGFSVRPNEGCSVSVTFQPVSAGNHYAKLVVTGIDAFDTASAQLQGTAPWN